MTISQGLLLFFISLPLCLISSAGLARDKSKARQDAFILMTQGREKFSQERYLEAIQLWRRAFETYEDNKLLFFIASTYSRLQGVCEDEEKAWQTYLSACREGICPNKSRGLQRHQQFKSRCYITLNLSTSASKAVATYQGQLWGELPLKKDLLMKRYNEVKISAPHYLSKVIEVDLNDPSLRSASPSGREQSPVNQATMNVTLIQIPKETFFETHQLKLALSTAIIGVSLLSFGSLQLSSASSLSDEVDKRPYPSTFESAEEKRTAKAQYESDQERFESEQLWGGIFITTGVVALSAGVWMLLYQGPNALIHQKARKQGDLVGESSGASSLKWSIEPLQGGVYSSWSLKF